MSSEDYWVSPEGLAYRIEDIAHDLTWTSLNAVTQAYAEPYQVTLQWVTAEDDRVCDYCLDQAGLYDPQAILPTIPGHVLCLPGNSLVSPRGRITGVTKRVFNGDLVIIHTARGHDLSVTPNHPIACEQGWIPAHLLDKGDYVVCERGSEFAKFPNRNHEYMPAPIEEIANAFLMEPTTLRCEVPTSTEDFHGDGRNSEVAIVGTNRHLIPNRKISLLQHASKLPLVRRNMRSFSFMGFSNPYSTSQTARFPSRGYMGRFNLHGSLLGAHVAPFQQLSFMLAPNMNSSLNEVSPNGASADMVLLSDLLLGNPGEIQLDQIVGIERDAKFQGDIYNLETSVGYFNAEGIIVHNCRCSWEYAPQEEGLAQ